MKPSALATVLAIIAPAMASPTGAPPYEVNVTVTPHIDVTYVQPVPAPVEASDERKCSYQGELVDCPSPADRWHNMLGSGDDQCVKKGSKSSLHSSIITRGPTDRILRAEHCDPTAEEPECCEGLYCKPPNIVAAILTYKPECKKLKKD